MFYYDTPKYHTAKNMENFKKNSDALDKSIISLPDEFHRFPIMFSKWRYPYPDEINSIFLSPVESDTKMYRFVTQQLTLGL